MFSTYIDFTRLTHSLKTALACLIGFGFGKLIGFSAEQWIVITIIVVMCAQIYVGSVLQKAFMRFLGTLIGCLFAASTLSIIGNITVALAGTLAIASFIFSYVATSQEKFGYAGTLGAVTTAIILMGQTPTLLSAAERFLEISAGLLIATLVSQFVLPINARTYLRRTQALTLSQLRLYYTAAIIEGRDNSDLDESIIKLLSKQRSLANESAHEPLGERFNPLHFMETLQYEKEILRSIAFMHRAVMNIPDAEAIMESPTFQNFNQSILHALDTITHAVERHEITKNPLILPSLKSMETEQNRAGLIFSAEELLMNLTKLAKLYHVPMKD